jgi:hypothetical protein
MNQPWLAVVLNIVLPGLGYIYNRQRILLGIGLAAFFGLIYFGIATTPSSAPSAPHGPIFNLVSFIVVILLYVGVAFDAHQEAVKARIPKPDTI